MKNDIIRKISHIVDPDISIKRLQELYDTGSDEVKKFIETICPKWRLLMDFDDFTDLTGYGYNPKTGELDCVPYISLYSGKEFKEYLEKGEYAKDGNCTELVYVEAHKLADDEVVLALWHEPRDDYQRNYIKGFIKIHKRILK